MIVCVFELVAVAAVGFERRAFAGSDRSASAVRFAVHDGEPVREPRATASRGDVDDGVAAATTAAEAASSARDRSALLTGGAPDVTSAPLAELSAPFVVNSGIGPSGGHVVNSDRPPRA